MNAFMFVELLELLNLRALVCFVMHLMTIAWEC